MSAGMLSLDSCPRDLAGLMQIPRGVRYRLAYQLGMFADDSQEQSFNGTTDEKQCEALAAGLAQRDAQKGVPQQQSLPMEQPQMAPQMGQPQFPQQQPQMPPQMTQQPMAQPGMPPQFAMNPTQGMPPQPQMGQPGMMPPTAQPPMMPQPPMQPQMAPPQFPQGMGQPQMPPQPAPPRQPPAAPQQPMAQPPMMPPMAQAPMAAAPQPQMPQQQAPQPPPVQAPPPVTQPARQPPEEGGQSAALPVLRTMSEALKRVAEANEANQRWLQQLQEQGHSQTKMLEVLLRILMATSNQGGINSDLLSKLMGQVTADDLNRVLSQLDGKGKG